MYTTNVPSAPDIAQPAYAAFLADIAVFTRAMGDVLEQWPNSAAHFLSNPHINRIAWLGQSSAFMATGLPARCRSGFFLLAPDAQARANEAADAVLRTWIERAPNNEDGPSLAPIHACRDRSTAARIRIFCETWERCGYPGGIPDTVPDALDSEQLAPSCRALARCLLKNDMQLSGVGFPSPISKWYGVLKRDELARRVA